MTRPMSQPSKPIVIKKYANRRLYNTGMSAYVTLEDLADMVREQQDFVVYDAKSGEDITRSVLTQIIFEQESKGQNLLPITFLRELIRLYGDSVQSIVPSYLDYSMSSFVKEQEKFRTHVASTIGASAVEAVEDQVRRNTEMFEKAMRMFLPFGAAGDTAAETDPERDRPRAADGDKGSGEIETLRRELGAMQARLDKLAKGGD